MTPAERIILEYYAGLGSWIALPMRCGGGQVLEYRWQDGIDDEATFDAAFAALEARGWIEAAPSLYGIFQARRATPLGVLALGQLS